MAFISTRKISKKVADDLLEKSRSIVLTPNIGKILIRLEYLPDSQ
jgi:hypothetical protein